MSNDDLELLAMQRLYDWVERVQLRKLSLPIIASGERGYSAVPMSKMLQLSWVVNRPVTPLLQEDRRTAAAITANGARLTPPNNKRYTIYSVWAQYAASATSGTRAVLMRIRNSADGILDSFMQDGAVANQIRNYALHSAAASDATVNNTINYPVIVDGASGMYFIILDGNAIDVGADTVSWQIAYQSEDST